MSAEAVREVARRLATDDTFRKEFHAHPAQAAVSHGLQLTEKELRGLSGLKIDDLQLTFTTTETSDTVVIEMAGKTWSGA